jgi:hypothetical protein
VVSPDAPSSLITETSSVLSYPSHTALYLWPLETSVAVSPVVSSMTWLLVSTRPFLLITMPVAWAVPPT